ncbi:TonB family C-terminal domain-containing protein [Sphingomonas palmae]|uniref:TonB family C-terminal domain-containing protein n=1 Tax=Sphingomonas palmae TaxID=1855283 RepID=A0A1H7I507_9SPHN|nr:energy transducer TonB [Sphingomonas palmae]SEK57619.1 TonB family C-terminal domain-containing protein [Sphingomonas palmae]
MIDDLEDLARRQARAQNGLDPSHMRPQPWFVGSGKRLTWLIVAIVAVLIALRGVTTLWLAQDAWNWWTHRKPARVVGPPPVYVPKSVRSEPPPPTIVLPPRATKPKGSPAGWFGADSYPPAAIRAEEEGRTVARVLIGTNGRVESCGIVTSSGSNQLDAATCRILVSRGIYEPARDESGSPIRSTMQMPVRWVLPRN